MKHWKKLVVLLLAAALLAVGVTVARDPYAVIRADFTRQRLHAGLSKGEVEVAGHRWVYAYSDAAPVDAPLLVMLHGYTGGKENWYPLARLLRSRYRLLIPDLPGWGDSERKPGQDYGYLAQSRHVGEFIQRMSGGKPVVLLGHSMGGGITALVAAAYPERVSHVGLLNASGVRFADNDFTREVRSGGTPFAVSDRASLRSYIDRLFLVERAKPFIPWPADAIYIARRRRDAAFEATVLQAIARSEQSLLPGEAAADVHQPALLLTCRQDQVIDASATALYARQMPHATQVTLDGCGHMSLMEDPLTVAQAVTLLIERGQPR